MEFNTANVASHKMFCEELSFVDDKKLDKKKNKTTSVSCVHRHFTHSSSLRNNNNFFLNVTEWLACPCGTKFSKLIEELSKEELNVFLKRFCTSARNNDGALSIYKSSSMKSI